jgi:flagellar basal-body rod protein FlgF
LPRVLNVAPPVQWRQNIIQLILLKFSVWHGFCKVNGGSHGLGKSLDPGKQTTGIRMSENMQLINLSKQIALQRQMDVVANNIANINTTGFKAEDVLFEEYKMPVARDRNFSFSDQSLSFTQDWATVHNMANGPISQTNNPLDVALAGPGFLTVQTAAGNRYTRAGSLQIDPTGTLVDMNGNAVLSDGGPVKFDPSETDITIGKDGSISSSAGAKGKLSIVEFADPQTLTRDGSNLYAGGTPQANVGTQLVQGSIERSNVSGVTEMASMIKVQRAYESLSNLMQNQDDLRRTAVQRLGDMSA